MRTKLPRPRLPFLSLFFTLLGGALAWGQTPSTTEDSAEGDWIREAHELVERTLGIDFGPPVEVVFFDPFAAFDLEAGVPEELPPGFDAPALELDAAELDNMGPPPAFVARQQVLARLRLIPTSLLELIEGGPVMFEEPGDLDGGGFPPELPGGGDLDDDGPGPEFDGPGLELGGPGLEFAMEDFPPQVVFDGEVVMVIAPRVDEHEEPTEELRRAVIRELVVALHARIQPAMQEDGAITDDARAALQALAQGAASWVLEQLDGAERPAGRFAPYFEDDGHGLREGWQRRAELRENLPPLGWLGESEPADLEALVRWSHFGAAHGRQFQRTIRSTPALHERLATLPYLPPVSTEQILHPEKYAGEGTDLPVDLGMEAFTRLIQEQGASVEGRSELGEWGTRCALLRNGAADPAAAAAGWDGDLCLAVHAEGHEQGIVWGSRWDSEAEASEFALAARAMLLQLHGERGSVVVQDGVQVLVLGGLGADLTHALASLGAGGIEVLGERAQGL